MRRAWNEGKSMLERREEEVVVEVEEEEDEEEEGEWAGEMEKEEGDVWSVKRRLRAGVMTFL